MASNPQQIPKPPRGLTASTREWYCDTAGRWILEPHHTRLLGIAARAFDEHEAASAIVRKVGLLITMPSGAQRPNPAIRIANEARAMFVKTLRELDLDLEGPADAQRPPALRSIGGKR
jgi:phage terminase small subunit